MSELLVNPVFISLLPVLLTGPSNKTLSFAALISLIKIFADVMIGKAIEKSATNNDLHTQPAFAYFLGPIKDVIIGMAWFAPIVSATVVWRGNRYLIGKDSRLSPCPATGVWSWGYRLTNVIRTRFA